MVQQHHPGTTANQNHHNNQQQQQQLLLCPKLEDGANANAHNSFCADNTNSAPTTPAALANAQMGQMSASGPSMFAPMPGSSGGQMHGGLLSSDPSSLLERSGSLSSISDPSGQFGQANNPSTSSSSGNSLSCTVCGDVATGRHYGSVACNGCKGFFRRTIRRNYKYTCRFNSNCQIDRHNRAVCRACRYSRCIQYGMKVDAVQSERDLIGKRSRYSSTPGPLGAGGPGSAAASPPQSQSGEDLASSSGGAPQQKASSSSYQMPSDQASQPAMDQQQQQFDGNAPSSSSSDPSAPSVQPQPPPAYMGQSLSQYSSLDNDEPVPRKRSFSSGSRFEQMAQLGRRQFLQQQQQTANKPSLGEQLMAEEQQQQQEQPGMSDPWSGRNSKGLLSQLLRSEEKIRNMREAVIAQTCNLEYTTKGEPNRRPPQMRFGGGNGTRKANENDILQSLYSQLLLVIEWAKTLKPFAELPTEDQTALLKNFAAQHVVLCVAYRSTSDFLKLINDSCIPRIANGDDKDLFYRKDAERVMDLLVSPMRFLRLDDVEFVAMKACILFNPVARGLSAPSVMSVLQTRRYIFRGLQQYIQSKMPPDEDRIGDLTFFILSPLQSLAKAVSEDVLVGKLSGVARLDQLMEELILEDNDPKETPMNSSGGGGQQQQQQSGVPQSPSQSGPSSNIGNSGAAESNASVAGQLFLAAAVALSNSPTGQAHWTGPNSPPQQDGRAGGNNYMCSAQQRSRHLSSSASSSSNSPPMALLQPVPPTPYPGQQRPSIGPLSPINESELNSSALSSYVFGASLNGRPNSTAFPAPSSGGPAPPSSSLPSAIARSIGGQQDVMHSAATSSGHSNPMSPPSSSSGQHFQAGFRPREAGGGHQHQGEFWPSQLGSGLLFTPSTPSAAIYSGTTPSPPQRFGIGGSG